MKVDFHVIIPARYQSSRLPGKLLMDLHGISVLERVYRQAIQAKPKSIIIATDNDAIFKLAQGFGATVEMTDIAHQSGTDRIAEVVERHKFSPEEIIVNVQGDEPLIDPALITQVANSLINTEAPMATLCWPVEGDEMLLNSNVVKVVRNCHNNALYFSRNTIPFNRDGSPNYKNIFRHIGVYAYRASFLLDYVKWPVCELEAMEALEQLRVLWAGYQIKVDEACVCPLQDINTMSDLERAHNKLAR